MLMRDVGPCLLPEGDAVVGTGVHGAGISTAGWFEAQLDLCLVGVMACFAWEKALGEEYELRWWEARVGQAVHRQGLNAG
jgi:hypothetical protein